MYKGHPMVVVTGGKHNDPSVSTSWTTEIWDATDSDNEWKYLKEEYSNSMLLQF